MKSRKSFFTSLSFIVICLTGSALCLLLFWRDLNATLERLDEEPVGIIEFRYNTAQRRFADRVLWDRLRNGSPVFNGDFIRIADLSEATITFALGDIIDLSANTMVQFFADNRGTRMDLGEGGINVNSYSAEDIVIYSGDSRLSVAAGTVMRAASVGGGGLDIAVSQGAVVVETATGAYSVGAGSGLVLSSAGEVLAVPQAVAISPPPGARFLSQQPGALPVNFIWNKINYPSGGVTRLEVASDRNFSHLFFTGDTSLNDFDLALPEGTWFWRLKPVTGEAREEALTEYFLTPPYSRITIVYSPTPSLISPFENQMFSYRSRPPSLRFQWTSSTATSFYLLEIADNPALQNPALFIEVSSDAGNQRSVASSALGEGSWYWRVTPVYSRSFTERQLSVEYSHQPSATGRFVIERGAPLLAPVLTAPAENARVNIGTGRQDLIFSWRKDNEAASYTVRVSANSDMSSPVIEQTVTNAFFRHSREESVISEGTWYWTVQQTAADGLHSPASQPRAFSASRDDIIQRTVFPPDNFVVTESLLPSTRFTWHTNLPDTRFQVSRSADFSLPLIDESVPRNVHTVYSLPGGIYYWRVTNDIGTGRLESPARRFEVAAIMPRPELGLPASALAALETGNVIISDARPEVNFTWEPVPQASYHIFRLYRAVAAQSPILETVVPGAAFSLNMGGFQEGDYIWSVHGLVPESVTSSRRTGPAAARPMSVSHLRPIVLEHPRGGWAFDGLAASRSPDTLRWSSRDTPRNVVFTLARDALMTNIVHRQTGIPREHILPSLAAGDYFWTVQALNAEGFDISSSAPAHFRVLPILLLPAPENRIPANNYTITPARIMAERSIVFSWDPVEGANGYVLTVFQGTGATRVPVTRTSVLRETVYTIEDIRLLGRGDFSWYVESLYVLGDGNIERRGNVLENSLYVDIPSPLPIRTIDTGILHGR